MCLFFLAAINRDVYIANVIISNPVIVAHKDCGTMFSRIVFIATAKYNFTHVPAYLKTNTLFS